MSDVVIAFFVPTIVFLVIVAPLWILMHYRSKQRARSELSAEERQLLELLTVRAERMGERIETLESILDDETPGWRARLVGAGILEGELVSDNRNDPPRDATRDARNEFQRSVERLEKAVQGFVSATNDHVTNRAAEFVDDTAERLERELRNRRGSARRAIETRRSLRVEAGAPRASSTKRVGSDAAVVARRGGKSAAAPGLSHVARCIRTNAARRSRVSAPVSRGISASRCGWCAASRSPG